MIVKDKVLQLVEPHFIKSLIHDKYEIKTIKSISLLSNIRFDLAFKLLYLDMRNKNVEFAKNIYKEHIRAFSLGKFIEPGNEDKNSIDKFIDEFELTFECIKSQGFDSNKTLIPLSKNGSIVNGAHRVASAIYLDKSVDCVEINVDEHIYDYRFFYNRNVSSDILDIVATKFVEYADNVYIAIIWPTAQGCDDEIEKIIPNIVYRKEITLNPNGAHNLLSQIYYGELWLGNAENNFSGSRRKLIECFKTFDPVRVIAFQADTLDEVVRIKGKVRDLFKVDKHSIHITDTKEEALRVSRVIFNNNSIHFLNNAKPNVYLDTYKKINKFKEFLSINDLSPNDVLLDSSIVLSAYGLRKAKDIDFFCLDNTNIKNTVQDINIHDEELQYYGENKHELILNPQNYFYFQDLKFISFEQLYEMKKNRAEEKDINDCTMMEALLERNTWKKYVSRIKQSIFYQKVKLKTILLGSLKRLRIYNLIRSIYRFLKGRR